MIKSIKNKKTYVTEQDIFEYNNLNAIDIHDILTIHKECPAFYKYAEKQPIDSSSIGIVAHAALMTDSKFEEKYIRDIGKNDFEDMLTSDVAVKSYLKEQGRPAPSKLKGEELYAFCDETNAEHPKIFKQEQQKIADTAKEKGLTVVNADDYDSIVNMRKVIKNNEFFEKMFKDNECDIYISCDVIFSDCEGNEFELTVKGKVDIITPDYIDCSDGISGHGFIDYKTSSDVSPETFGLRSHDSGDWIKQAFLVDIFASFFETNFKPGILAQCKKSPYIPQLYWLTHDQIEIGRFQYLEAIKALCECESTGNWYTYADNECDLQVPDFIKRKYGIE